MKMKHNKKRNTAFIYEVVIRELAKAIHEGDLGKKKKIIKLIREAFNSNTIMGKDLELYKSILETKDVDRYAAEKIMFQSSDSQDDALGKLLRARNQANR